MVVFLFNSLVSLRQDSRTFGKKVRPAGERQTAVCQFAKRMSQGSEATAKQSFRPDQKIQTDHLVGFFICFLNLKKNKNLAFFTSLSITVSGSNQSAFSNVSIKVQFT